MFGIASQSMVVPKTDRFSHFSTVWFSTHVPKVCKSKVLQIQKDMLLVSPKKTRPLGIAKSVCENCYVSTYEQRFFTLRLNSNATIKYIALLFLPMCSFADRFK